jgi:hypothetical protein
MSDNSSMEKSSSAEQLKLSTTIESSENSGDEQYQHLMS